jgi:uncharacterized protein (UPF0264 family)
MMVGLLVSVRDVGEALAAAGAGADFIDCKEPADGALGALSPQAIGAIVAVLRERHPGLRISATIGDLPGPGRHEILRRVQQVADRGVDYVKVGVWPGRRTVLDALAAAPASIVPVLVADAGVDPELVAYAVALQAFPALMLDTAQKGLSSLVQRVPLADLAAFVAMVRSGGMLAGLAGSLRSADLPLLRALKPDFAGFRAAVTQGERAAALDARLVRALRRGLAAGTRAPLPATG